MYDRRKRDSSRRAKTKCIKGEEIRCELCSAPKEVHGGDRAESAGISPSTIGEEDVKKIAQFIRGDHRWEVPHWLSVDRRRREIVAHERLPALPANQTANRNLHPIVDL